MCRYESLIQKDISIYYYTKCASANLLKSLKPISITKAEGLPDVQGLVRSAT